MDDSELMRILNDKSASLVQKREACRVLVERHSPTMLRCAQRILADRGLAEDAVQEALAHVALKAKSQYTPGRSLAPWLVSITKNKARDLRRRENRHRA